MANNGGGGRQGGAGGNGQMNEHVEFTVKAEEDLYLTGTENTIRRVTAETNYSCLMLKTQRFSSLFRHYAKYHGLRKDDLEYYFVNLLENEDTPETVQLQRGDTIMVRKKRKPEPPEAASDDQEFFKDMKELLDDDEHMDATFYVHPDTSDKDDNSSSKKKSKKRKSNNINDTTTDNTSSAAAAKIKKEEEEQLDNNSMHIDNDDEDDRKQEANGEDLSNIVQIRAHKCILTARADYFKALFRKAITGPATSTSGGSIKITQAFRESSECIIRVEPTFHPLIIKYMLEFIYTNRISTLNNVTTNDLLLLLHLSDKWLLRDLKRLVEHELIRNHMEIQTVARMYCATEDYHANRLSKACIDFIMANIRQVTGNATFQEEMRHYPHLCIPVLKAAADLIPEQNHQQPPLHKKQRISENLLSQQQQEKGTGSSSASAAIAAAAAAANANSGTTTPNATTSGGTGTGGDGDRGNDRHQFGGSSHHHSHRRRGSGAQAGDRGGERGGGGGAEGVGSRGGRSANNNPSSPVPADGSEP